MIKEKLDITNLIEKINEIEKLKLLLFDSDQLSIFEKIPKPYLLDRKMMKNIEKQIDQCNLPGDSPGRNTIKEQAKEVAMQRDILVTNNAFWKKKQSDDKKIQNFVSACKNLRHKQNLNIIDKRLIELMEKYNIGS